MENGRSGSIEEVRPPATRRFGLPLLSIGLLVSGIALEHWIPTVAALAFALLVALRIGPILTQRIRITSDGLVVDVHRSMAPSGVCSVSLSRGRFDLAVEPSGNPFNGGKIWRIVERDSNAEVLLVPGWFRASDRERALRHIKAQSRLNS